MIMIYSYRLQQYGHENIKLPMYIIIVKPSVSAKNSLSLLISFLNIFSIQSLGKLQEKKHCLLHHFFSENLENCFFFSYNQVLSFQSYQSPQGKGK